MKDKQAKYPQLRFKGFTDPWVQRNLSDLATFSKGKGYSKSDLVSDGFPAILYGRMYTNYESQIDDISDTFVADATDAVLSQTGDVIVPGSGETPEDIARASNVNVSGIVLGGDINIIRPDTEKMDSTFLALTISNGQQQTELIKRAQGKSVVHLHNSDLKKVNVVAPSKDEQSAISSLFTQLDNLIAANQRKLDLLKEQKKGYLQKMFPKNGAKVPELRFAGFADDWEERKFKDIIEKLTGGASIKPSDYLEEGIRTIPKGAVNSTGLADLSGSKYISEEFYESNKSSHVSTNNLVTSLRDLVPSAPNMGRIVRIAGEDEDFLMPQGVYKLELFDGMDEEFLIAFSNSDKYRKIISSEKNGSTQVHIRNGEFLNIDIELPFSEEQKQIGSFFKQLDNSIALHQHKLDLLKEQKKGFLQKMFV